MSHLDADGYVLLRRNVGAGRTLEHVAIAERAIGAKLPPGAIVHHIDEDRTHNANENLVICPNRAYHNLLHQRMRAQKATGNANARKCCRCLQYDAITNLSISGKQAYHPACNAEHARKILEKKKC